ncbi:YcnI family copper-binding membrane protein [Mycobacterium sp. NPDC003449]
MNSPIGARSRVPLITAAAAAASAGLLTAAPAWAHVHVDAEDAAPGSTSVLTFRVPGESDTGALTTQLSVALPKVTSARTEVLPGWTARLDRDTAAGTVSSVTWTAAPGVGISPDQFALFRISVTLPDSDTVSFPTTQTYSDGTVVRWDQAPLPGGGEPEHPAPQLALSQAGDHPAAPPTGVPPADPAAAPASATDNSARWLAGGALVLAAAAVVAALLGRRRS